MLHLIIDPTMLFLALYPISSLDIGGKRATSETAEQIFECLKHARIVKIRPSETVKSAEYESLQKHPL
jgi:hypothetical protein